MYRAFLFNVKLLAKNYLVIFVVVVSLLMVVGVLVLSSGSMSSPPAIVQGKVGVYTGFPIPISFGGIKMYTSTDRMVNDIKNMELPLGIDVPHRILYTSQIYADISTKALSYMASAAENIMKGKGLYPYNDDVWWDPFAVNVGKYSKAIMLLFIFLIDFLLMYLSLATKAKLYKTDKLWHLLGISQWELQISFIAVAFLSATIVSLPIIFYQPQIIKIVPVVILITLISTGVSAYFLRYATNMLVAYLSMIPTLGFLFVSWTYVLLPDKLGLAKYLPWTFAVYDIHRYAGADGMISGINISLMWIVYGVWSLLSLVMWYKGVIENA